MHHRRILSAALFAAALIGASATGQTTKGLYDESLVRTLELNFKQRDYWKQLHDNRVAKVYIKADLKVDGRTYRDVGVRFRGNSSWLGVIKKDKKPFKISLDEFVPGQRLLGHRTLNLNNNFLDPSHMREPIVYGVLREFVSAPRNNFVTLRINGQNWGLYSNVEQINKDFLKTWFDGTEGVRWRGEWQKDEKDQTKTNLSWLGSNVESYKRFYRLQDEGRTDSWQRLVGMIGKLNNSGSAIESELPKMLDVDQALRYLVGCNLVPIHDSYTHFVAHNYWMFDEDRHGRFRVIPWDVNNSLGSYPFIKTSQLIVQSPLYKATDSKRPLLSKILARHRWKQRYLAHFRSARKYLTWSHIGPKVAAYRKLIEPILQNDPKRLYSMQQFRDSLSKSTKVEIWVAGLSNFVQSREKYLRGHSELNKAVPTMDYVAHWPFKPTSLDRVQIKAKMTRPGNLSRVTCFWRENGAFKTVAMRDDGKEGDFKANDGIYAVLLPTQRPGSRIEYYVEAENKSSVGGAFGYGPEFGAFRPKHFTVDLQHGKSAIVINEFLAKNVSGLQDNKGEYEDWIELYNSGNARVLLDGLTLSDDFTTPGKWPLPKGLALNPGETLLIWADGDVAQGPLHANFKLSSSGEKLGLFDRGKLVDSIEFGSQLADVSTGRLFDGRTTWVTFARPSPRSRNIVKRCDWRTVDALDPTRHQIALRFHGSAVGGQTITISAVGAPANTPMFLALAGIPARVDVPALGVSLMLGTPPLVVAPFVTDAYGQISLPVALPKLDLNLVLQGFAFGGRRFFASNGLEIRVCK